MCRGVVEDLPTNEIEDVAFEEEEEEINGIELPGTVLTWENEHDLNLIYVGNGNYVAMNINQYHDFILNNQISLFDEEEED